MVAIIGKKGSGKSALADVLALAGNSHCDTEYFSFLNKQRFCERGGRLAKQFSVRPLWMDGTESELPLNSKPDLNEVERVRYIPQTYLEKVCAETEPGQQSAFQIELRKVIFAHVSDAEKLGRETLDDLIAYKTEELQGQVASAREDVASTNAELVRLEEKATPTYSAHVRSADKAESVKGLQAHLAYLGAELPAEIEKLREQRRKDAGRIHLAIAGIRDVYKELFAPVQELITTSPIIKEGFKLTFESSIIERSLQNELFERYISQGVAGSFYGKEKGAAILEEIRSEFDVNEVQDAQALAQRIVEHLDFDMRSAPPTPTGIVTQLRKSVDVKSLYDFLWGFAYLEPEYSLKLDGKDLVHLSPGERGTLLLVFYLLVDKSNKPIIVDQPEENLDSETVYRLLIPVIKEVKKRRQIIMVTHSPNIAVVCDAEQIIHANIDPANGNAVTYSLGSIESPQLNSSLVKVLEGTRPAFENREAKYHFDQLPAATESQEEVRN